MTLFQSIPIKIARNVCRNIRYEAFNAHDIVFKQGHWEVTPPIPFNCLRFRFAILFRSPRRHLLHNPEWKRGRHGARRETKGHTKNIAAGLQRKDAARPYAPPFPFPLVLPHSPPPPPPQVRVDVLRQGSTFGELAMIDHDARRSASIVVSNYCDLVRCLHFCLHSCLHSCLHPPRLHPLLRSSYYVWTELFIKS
jgi:hypothetical protein